MALLEVCVDALEPALAAPAAGADRLELCARLDVGGLTPASELALAVIPRVGVPCHLMLRPRAGDFVYSRAEFARMQRELERIRGSGAAGVVLGVLTSAGAVDSARVRELALQARPLALTFHRAFDEVRDQGSALEALIDLGIERVLTSGGAPSAFEGRTRLRELVERAGDRILVMPGGGVRASNAAAILAATGATELHSSTAFYLRRST